MSKRNSIKWREKDNKKIANIARIFNAKITRTLKAHPEFAEYMPERIDTKKLKNSIKTRNDFNREIKSYERFMEKGAELPILTEKGIKTTKWEKKELGYKVAQINRNRTAERKKADVSTFKGTMGSIQNNNLLPKAYNIDKISPREWGKYKETVNKQIQSTYVDEKLEKYKLNYIGAIDAVFGDQGSEIKTKIENIPPGQLIKLFYDDPVLQLDFIYDPLEMSLKIEGILEHLNSWGY